jgi:Txe/YoeB family toxin of Txe-Axe toxin-antitoxin module
MTKKKIESLLSLIKKYIYKEKKKYEKLLIEK